VDEKCRENGVSGNSRLKKHSRVAKCLFFPRFCAKVDPGIASTARLSEHFSSAGVVIYFKHPEKQSFGASFLL
jgi:hypothetical protein